MKRLLMLLLLVGVVIGCAPWVLVDGKHREESQDFEVNLPKGWRRANMVKDSLLITRDGVTLQQIAIERVGVGKDLNNTKKKFTKGMLPQDVADVEMDEVRFDQAVQSFKLLENVPFQVAGFPGFKLVYTFKTKDGLRLKRVHYGMLLRNWVYRIHYQAAARYYFDKDFATFERVRKSFRVMDKAS